MSVATPAAWCLAPLQQLDWVTDPDVDDDPPRYPSELRDGWGAIAKAVVEVYDRITDLNVDVLTRRLDLSVRTPLTSDQEWIVHQWFVDGEAPQWSPRSESWLNGRHRTWALKNEGCPVAPVMLIPVRDAIYFWEDDPFGWPPLDSEAVGFQRDDLRWWSNDERAHDWRELSRLSQVDGAN